MSLSSILKQIKSPIVGLSPMDGWTDSPFRRVCKEVNPSLLMYTEFTSAEGVAHGAEVLRRKLAFDGQEHPILAQIFGADLKSFLSAARYCEEMGFDGIDLNMGCPARKVVKSEQGVALRKKPEKAFALVAAVVDAVSIPVTVKTRLGWNDASDLLAFGKGIQDAGASMIAIHGRTFTVPYSAPADFDPIYELKRELKIPVLGNGGITSLVDGASKLGNLDGYLIGQAAMGNPWVFSEKPAPSFSEKIPIIKKHLEYHIEFYGERIGLLSVRKHMLAYMKSFPGASVFRARLSQAAAVAEIHDVFDSALDSLKLV